MTTKTETSSGFSFQPDLFNKMYDDGKFAVKERNAKNEAEKRRAENKKRREEAEAAREAEKRKKEKNKPMSRKEKQIYTIIICVSALFCVPLSLYFSASLLNKLKKASGPNADLNVKLPTNEESLPYKNQSRSAALRAESNSTKSYSESIDNSRGGGRRKKRHQRGGNNTTGAGGEASAASSSFSAAAPVAAAANEVKGFTDSTKYGFPYNLAHNDNPILADFGQYFITYFSFVRGIGVKSMEVLNDSYFKNFNTEKGKGSFSSNVGNKLMDWATIAFILPFLTSISTMITFASSTVGLFWSAITNQSIGMIPWLIFASVTVFFGGLNWPSWWSVGGKDLYLLSNGSSDNLKTFATYLKRYIFWWLLIIFLIWGLAIWGFMGGGFGKKIKREFDYQIWIIAGFVTPMAVWLISLIGFASIFGHDSDKS